ncbi:SGNH/GDSL hydrolase family protein [Bacillus sp. JJ1533]|uniref:SGNH/GDSL hydrolase family protein n=1 Tax=Bacillus sp. JJ1533 TaxID=3122959 RepID=UPI002FFDDBC5
MQKLMRRTRSLLIMLMVMLAFSPLSVLAEGENPTINYVALGDSLAEGMLSDSSFGSGYVGMIKSDLETNGYQINVHNAGYRGFKTENVLAGLPILEIANADIITISAGANDILAVVQPVLGLQQAAQVATQESLIAKSSASDAINAVRLSVDEAKTAIVKVDDAVTLASEEISLLGQYLTPEQLAKITPALGLIQEAKVSITKAEENVDGATLALDTNAQDVLGNLEAVTSHLGIAAQKLNSVVDVIGMIESLNISLAIPNILNVKAKANEAITGMDSANSKIESTKLAVNTYFEAKAKAEAAQLAATTAIAEAVGVKVPEVLKNVGTNTAQILTSIRKVNPTAKIYVMGYYNALPYLPTEVQESMTKPILDKLNKAIELATTQLGATFVPVADLFEGNHLTYLPNPGNIHPSEAGYRALASAFMAQINVAYPVVTEPSPIEQEIDLGEETLVNSDEFIKIKGTNVTLLLPDNLPEGTTLSVTTTSEEVLSKAKTGELELFGAALNFKFKYPEEFEDFVGTFRLTMGYDTDSPDNVAIYHFNKESGKWEIQQGEKNKELKTISLDVTHFSNYGVFAQVDKPAPPVTKDPVDDPKDDGGTPPPVAKDPSKGPKDSGKKDTKKDTKKSTSKGKLPKTATNYYNLLLVGTSLLLSGAMIFVVSKRRRLILEK